VRKIFAIILGSIFVGLLTMVFALGVAGFESFRVYKNIQHGQLTSSETNAAAASGGRILHFFSSATLHKLPDLELWRMSLEMIPPAQQLSQATDTYLAFALHADPASKAAAEQIKTSSAQLSQQVETALPLLQRSVFFSKITEKKIAFLGGNEKIQDTIRDFNILVQSLLTGKHRYIVLFQNSEELRATGGFMGSYASVSLKDGQVTQMEIQDIYEPDGQFQGFAEAPHGLKEYLSSGHGLRLPDANWNPDFPSSAKTILNFFGFANQKDIDGVVAVNLHVAQDLLNKLGTIDMPEYGISVTAENLPVVARADRAHFFPGSTQKRDFLSALFTQLKLKFAALDTNQRLDVLQTAAYALATKDIQLYSNSDEIQAIFEKHLVAGQILPSSLLDTTINSSDVFPIFLVESNVGINKANRGVTREVEVIKSAVTNGTQTYTPDSLELRLHFHNHNLDPDQKPADSPLRQLQLLPPQLSTTTATDWRKPNANTTGYINYQRLLVPDGTSVTSIQVSKPDGSWSPLTHWDEETISTSTGAQLQQIGFLLTIPAGANQDVKISLQNQLLTTNPKRLLIHKQSGLPPTPYLIQTGEDSQSILLDRDQLVIW
jgi:hypothetical protein